MMGDYDFGCATLYEPFLRWKWYNDLPVEHLFIHLLLTANPCPYTWRKKVSMERGERVISYPQLNEETELSIQELRTCIRKLKETGDISIRTCGKYTVVKITDYEYYQQGYQQGCAEENDAIKQVFNSGDRVKNQKGNRVTNNGSIYIINNTKESIQDSINNTTGSIKDTAIDIGGLKMKQHQFLTFDEAMAYIDSKMKQGNRHDDVYDAFAAYVDMRYALGGKNKLTCRAIDRLFKRIDGPLKCKTADDVIACLDQSTIHNWVDLWEVSGR